VTLAASLHFAASFRNPNGLRDEMLKEPLAIDQDGMMRLPERPGLGIELDPAALARYRVD